MDKFTIQLEAGHCIEVVEGRGPDDGTLWGYAIRFAGSWDAWEFIGGGRMVKIANGVELPAALAALGVAPSMLDSEERRPTSAPPPGITNL